MEMRPTLTARNRTNCRTGNAVGGCDLLVRLASFGCRDYLKRLRFSQFSPWRFLAMHMAALSNHVSGVVSRGSQKEVRGIHARGIVARVADKHAGRNSPLIRDLPSDDVRVGITFPTPPATNLAVSLDGVPEAHPWPAFIWATSIGLRCKSFGYRFHADAVAQN